MSDPNATHALFAEALGLHAGGRTQAALEIARRVLVMDPEHADALFFQGVLALEMREFETAVSLLERAAGIAPERSIHHIKLGVALVRLGRNDEAVAALLEGLRLEPDSLEASFALGRLLMERREFESAGLCFARVLERQPSFAEAHLSFALTCRACGDPERAWVHAQKAVELRPTWGAAHADLAMLLLDHLDFDRAIACLRRALELSPTLTRAHVNLGNALLVAGLAAEALRSYERALEIEPSATVARHNLAFAAGYDPNHDERSLLSLARACWSSDSTGVRRFEHQNERSPERRLRIGYVSPDFRNHPMAFVTLPMFRNHDKGAFEIHCYSAVETSDALTREIARHADGWRSLLGVRGEQGAELIHADGIDILVDLTMCAAGNRLDVFVYKPAPVQACWIGYPGTTGLDAIDYRITDPHLDPPERDASAYTETSLHLPDCYWCYDPVSSDPAVSALPALESGVVTFGSLNNLGKTNPSVLALWARVLGAVPRSRLLLLAPRGEARTRVRGALAAAGVEPERVLFVEQTSRKEYLETYRRIDVGLDPFPYNGHVTSLDAFWMGVPVVTLVGRTSLGRAGLAFAKNLGLDELVTFTPDEYVERAVELARDLNRLADLRGGLRRRMQGSPLMDGARFARNMESLYRRMWRTFCAARP